MSPITCKTKITDGVKNVNSLFNIIDKQTSFFEYVNLLFCGYGLMRVSNSHKKMSRWVRWSYGKRAGFVNAKVIYYLEYTKRRIENSRTFSSYILLFHMFSHCFCIWIWTNRFQILNVKERYATLVFPLYRKYALGDWWTRGQMQVKSEV